MRAASLILLFAVSAGALCPAPARGQTLSPYQRSVPAGELTAEPLALSIVDAIQRALDHNLGALYAEQRIGEAGGARWKALSELLPNLSGRLTASREKVNLEAFGFPLPAGIPAVVGPFNVYDARVFLTQSVYDVQKINEVRAEEHKVDAARFESKNARDIVVLIAGNAYSLAVASSAMVEAARAQLDTAQALAQQAADLKQGGLVAGIDVVRADVQLATARQRLTAAQVEFDKRKLTLARIIGLPLGQAFTLTDQIRPYAFPDISLERAVDQAYRSRSDYQAALARVRAAEANRQAAAGEALPSVKVTADYGDIGLSPRDSHGSFNVTGALNVPIFQGGKTKGKIMEADAELKVRRAEAEEMKSGIYYEVRAAFLDLQAGQEQLQVAARARELAASQLTQARDRFAAGVAGNIEVVQAQEAVALASDQYITALFTSNLATGNLIRALGGAEDTARQLLGGVR
ncbi:MAG: TolC family protein [Acidobacteriia bacterium]|nr:TolC family protein [Terriglobia bacterium]